MSKSHKLKVVELIKRMNDVLVLLITEEIQLEKAMAQIDDLNAAVKALQDSETALEGRIAANPPAPDLGAAIAGILDVTNKLNGLVPAPVAPPIT